MARGSSLPYPQQSTTCPYPEPDSVQALPSYLYNIHFNIIFLPFYASIFQVVWFIHVSPPKYCIDFSPPFVLYAPPTRSGNAFIKHNRIFMYHLSSAVFIAVFSVYSTQNPVREVSYIKCTQHSCSKSFIFPDEGNSFTCRNIV
jgi:hypothetical protein